MFTVRPIFGFLSVSVILPQFIPNTMTRATNSFPVFIAIGIFLIEFMAMNAMRLCFFARQNSLSSQNVFATSYWLKMHRIDTSAIAAKMIKCETFGDRTDVMFIGKTMDTFHCPSSFNHNAHFAVTHAFTGNPYNAAIILFCNFVLESFKLVGIHGPDFTTACNYQQAVM